MTNSVYENFKIRDCDESDHVMLYIDIRGIIKHQTSKTKTYDMIQHDKIKEKRHEYMAFLRNIPRGYLNMINNKDIESAWKVIVPHII